jgi:hypothetical protein
MVRQGQGSLAEVVVHLAVTVVRELQLEVQEGLMAGVEVLG